MRNIEITNSTLREGEVYNQGDLMDRTGVSIVAKDRGTLHGIELDSLYVHDVDGNVYDKHLNNGGIYASALTPADESRTGIARYDGLHIHHCRVERCRRWGIAAGYTYQHGRFTTLELPDEVVRTYGSVNVVIEHNRNPVASIAPRLVISLLGEIFPERLQMIGRAQGKTSAGEATRGRNALPLVLGIPRRQTPIAQG